MSNWIQDMNRYTGPKPETYVERLERELKEAYAEMRKQRPSITAVFDRSVWDRADQYKEKPHDS